MCEKCENEVPKSFLVEHIFGAQVEPIKIKLVKGQKDSYGWEIGCAGSDMAEILKQIRAADAVLKKEYGGAA